jgi:anaerobic magnesium-protoporphyrin IX monomethyl ester cyclase
MKIVLINPPSEKGKYEHDLMSIPKIGIGYLCAFLEKNSIECSIIDSKFERIGLEEVLRRVEQEAPDIVGISAMTSEIHSGAEAARKIKERMPSCTTVVGGAHSISIPQETMEEFPEFDILVTGEGEYTLLEIVNVIRAAGPLDDIKGIMFRRDGQIVSTPQREWIEDLDSLPFPAWHKYPRVAPFYYVLSSRGCPNNCAFCKTILGKRQRKRSPENVVDEIQWLHDRFGVKKFIFQDETFTLDRKRTEHMLDLMIERGLHSEMEWVAQTRVDRVDEHIFTLLKRAGCGLIEFGVESGNQEILNTVNKRITLQQVEDAVRLAKKAGLKVGCSFILGHPFETRKTAQDTVDFLVKLNPDNISLGIMVPLPGTRIYEMAKKGEGNYRLTSTDWRDFVKFGGGGLEFTNISRHELEKMQAKAYLSLYLKNFRVIDLVSYAYEHRKQALAAAKKLVRL